MSNLDDTIAHLDTTWRTALHRWEETKQVWHDAVRIEFEKEVWAPLEGLVPPVRREMENLSQIIAQAKRNIK